MGIMNQFKRMAGARAAWPPVNERIFENGYLYR